LQTLGERLLEIHGQHEHQALLDKARQLDLLDAYGAHAALREEVAAQARRWRDVSAEIRALAGGQDNSEHIALLEHQTAELDRYALLPGELDALNETHKRLANAGQLLQGSGALADLLDGDSEFTGLRTIGRAQNELARLAELDPRLQAARELLDAAAIQLGEANDLVARYRDALDLDPERLADAEAQIAKLHELSRKHRVPVAELKNHADALRAEMDSLRHAGARLRELESESQAISQRYAAAAAKLSAARILAAEKLGADVTALMAELGMRGGFFEAALEKTGTSAPDPQGAERTEFLVSANPGQPARALRKVASGGELSRISLAIEVAALGLDDVGCMVFDEVDSGIGGAVAEVVGQKLRRLGATRQVLCVTHLPQVAAQGHAHLQVVKSSASGQTQITIAALDGTSRRDEIARMLGGVRITRETLAHAQQMLEAGNGKPGTGNRKTRA
jgi:DNA repair protein RecN (Recombination protein N)